MKKYRKYKVWDILLCMAISLGLTLNLLSGFQIDDIVPQRLPLLAGVTVVVILLSFAAAQNKRTVLVGVIAGIAALAAVIVVSRRQQWFLNDAQSTMQILVCVAAVTSLLVFLGSRSRIGIFIILLLGNVIQAGAAFLEFPVNLPGYLVFLGATGMLLFYRVYLKGIRSSQSGTVRFGQFMVQNFCICMAALVLAGGVYAGIVKPLNPPTRELKLIQKLMSFEMLEKIGVSTTVTLPDPNQQSTQQDPEDSLTTDQREETQPDGMGADMETPQPEEPQNEPDQMEDQQDSVGEAMAVSYEKKSHWYLYVLLAAVILFLLLYRKKWIRKRWLAAMEQRSRKDAVKRFYAYFLYGFAYAGYRKAEGLTLDEYICLNQEVWSAFAVNDVTVQALNAVYQKVYYGQMEPSEQEYEMFRTFYAAFHKNLCTVMGRWNYFRYYMFGKMK